MEKVRPWCSQPSNRGRLKNRTDVTLLLIFGTVCLIQWSMLVLSRHLKHHRNSFGYTVKYDFTADLTGNGNQSEEVTK